MRKDIFYAGLITTAMGLWIAGCGESKDKGETSSPEITPIPEASYLVEYKSPIGFSIKTPSDWQGSLVSYPSGASFEEFVLNPDDKDSGNLLISVQKLDRPRPIEKIRTDQMVLLRDSQTEAGDLIFSEILPADCEPIDGQPCQAVSAAYADGSRFYLVLFENPEGSEIWSVVFSDNAQDFDRNIEIVKDTLDSIELIESPSPSTPEANTNFA